MAGTVLTPVPGSPQDYGDEAHYQISGTNTELDGKIVKGSVTLDPGTGLPALAGGTQSGGSVTIADGGAVTVGALADSASDNTVIGLLKNLKAALAGILAVKVDQTTPGTTNAVAIDQSTPGTTNATAASVADGADVVQGSSTDAAGTSSVLGQLKELVAQLGATLTVDASGTPVPVTVADGADVILGSSSSSAGEASVLGQLLALVAALGGTLTVDASGVTVPISAAAPLPTTPPKGATAFTYVTVGTTPSLVLAANPARISAIIQNVAPGSALVLGNDANVVASAPGEGQYLGLVIAPGGDAEDTDSEGAWYGVCASGSADVRIVEVA